MTVPIGDTAPSTAPSNAPSNALSNALSNAHSTPTVKLQHLGSRQRAILEILLNGGMGNAELQEIVAVSHRKDLSHRYLKPLLAGGAIAMSDPEHPNNPTQKYVITDLGRTLLKASRGKQKPARI